MKKIILAMLVALLIFGLVGCGSENASAPEETSMDESSSDISNDNITVPNEEEKEMPKEIAEKPRDEQPDETVREIPSKPAETIVAENEEVPPAMQEGQAPPQDGSLPPDQGDPGQARPGVPREGGQQMIDTASAADTLGVSEEALIEALGDAEQGPPDFDKVAETLGITVEELQDALHMPE